MNSQCLKKKKNGKIGKRKKKWWEEGGMVYSQKPRGGAFCCVSYLLGLRPRGPQTCWRRRAGHLCPRAPARPPRLPKTPGPGQRPARPGRHGARFLSHRPGHRRPRRSVLFRSLLETRACAAPLPACVCACVCVLVCVRLLEENRTVVSDLHYGRRTRVACLTALCETLVLRGQTAEKQRVSG